IAGKARSRTRSRHPAEFGSVTCSQVWELALQAMVSKPVARVSEAHPGPFLSGHHSPDARYALIRATKGKPGFLKLKTDGFFVAPALSRGSSGFLKIN
ncbi:MAG TPA: hypothetical protein VJ908_03585, partial [Wenzhouxiangellaceae bacterium]|nr:hypothetical protein [Wenzhouxiangellaceae bacterium]